MDFSYSDEQELLRDSLLEWLDRYVSEDDVRKWYYEDHAIPDEVLKAWMTDGFGMLGIPEEHGGTPVDVTTLAMVSYEVNRHFGCMASDFIGNALTMYDMAHWGNAEQIKFCMDFYKQNGKVPFALALSEPSAGSDNMAMTTTVKEVSPGKFVMNGTKTWLTSGERADYFLVVAKDEDPSGQSCSMWLVDKKKKGVSTAPLTKIGQFLAPFCEGYFDDVELDESDRVGEKGKGFLLLMQNFEIERTLGAAGSIGIAQACMDDAAVYSTQREQFGKPIANFQLIQEKLTDMEIKLINMRNFLNYCCWRIDNGQSVRTESALLKRYATMSATEVCEEAVEIFAGLGYTQETRVGRAWIDSKGNQIGAGTVEIMVHIAGRQIAKQYAK